MLRMGRKLYGELVTSYRLSQRAEFQLLMPLTGNSEWEARLGVAFILQRHS